MLPAFLVVRFMYYNSQRRHEKLDLHSVLQDLAVLVL
jgi:hypothetical protein